MSNERWSSDGSYLSPNPTPLEPTTLDGPDLGSPLDDFGFAAALGGSPYATARFRLSAANLRKVHRHLAFRSSIFWWILAFIETLVFVLVVIARQTSPDPQTASLAGFAQVFLVVGSVAAGVVWLSWWVATGISLFRRFRFGTADRYCAFYDRGILAVERDAEVAFIPWAAISILRSVGGLQLFGTRSDRSTVWIVPAATIVGDLDRLGQDAHRAGPPPRDTNVAGFGQRRQRRTRAH